MQVTLASHGHIGHPQIICYIVVLKVLKPSNKIIFIILLLGGGDVIETLGGHKTPVLKVVLCTCFSDPRFIAFIHFGPIYMFVRFAVHLYICYFVKVSNQIIFGVKS